MHGRKDEAVKIFLKVIFCVKLPQLNFEILALVYFCCSLIFGNFDNLKIEAVRGQIFKGMEAGVRGQGPLLGEGTRSPVRLS